MRYVKMFAFVMMLGISFSSIAGHYEDALNYRKEGRSLRMLLSFEKAAIEDGNVDAMMQLGGALKKAEHEYAFPYFARAAYLGNSDAQGWVGLLCSVGTSPCYSEGKEKLYPWIYMWFVLAGDSWRVDRDKFGDKMTAAERAEGERLAEEFRVFIAAKKSTEGVGSSGGSTPVETNQDCPESWMAFIYRWDRANKTHICGTYFTTLSYSLKGYMRGGDAILREEDVEFDNRKRKEERVKNLREGNIPIANIQDAWLVQENISDLIELMFSPQLKPDNKIYGAKLVLDSEAKAGILRVRWDSNAVDSVWRTPFEENSDKGVGEGLFRLNKLRTKYGGSVLYAKLKTSNMTTSFSKNLRLGNSVWVIGRYVANEKYTKINRTEGTMPVLDVLYIGD